MALKNPATQVTGTEAKALYNNVDRIYIYTKFSQQPEAGVGAKRLHNFQEFPNIRAPLS